MSIEQILDVCEKYDKLLHQKNIEIIEDNDTYGNLDHIRWMLNKIIDSINDNKIDSEKFNRWLGFIQGVLWSQEIRTINEMRKDNR